MEIRISDALTPDRMRNDLVHDMVTRFGIERADAEETADALFRRIRLELWQALFRRARMVEAFDQKTGESVGIVWVISEADSVEVANRFL